MRACGLDASVTISFSKEKVSDVWKVECIGLECIHSMECIVASDKVPKGRRGGPSMNSASKGRRRRRTRRKWAGGFLSISYVIQATRDAETHSAGDPPERPTFSSSNISRPHHTPPTLRTPI